MPPACPLLTHSALPSAGRLGFRAPSQAGAGFLRSLYFPPDPRSAASLSWSQSVQGEWGCPGSRWLHIIGLSLLLGTTHVLRRVRTNCWEISHKTHHRVQIWLRRGFPQAAPPHQQGLGLGRKLTLSRARVQNMKAIPCGKKCPHARWREACVPSWPCQFLSKSLPSSELPLSALNSAEINRLL